MRGAPTRTRRGSWPEKMVTARASAYLPRPNFVNCSASNTIGTTVWHSARGCCVHVSAMPCRSQIRVASSRMVVNAGPERWSFAVSSTHTSRRVAVAMLPFAGHFAGHAGGAHTDTPARRSPHCVEYCAECFLPSSAFLLENHPGDSCDRRRTGTRRVSADVRRSCEGHLWGTAVRAGPNSVHTEAAQASLQCASTS